MKIIKITNEKEFDFLIDNIRKCSFLTYFKNIEFGYIKPGYEELAKALQIRNKYKRTEYIYKQVCEIIDNYNSSSNIICKFNNNKCSDKAHSHRINGCCCHCIYQSNKGCTTKNLACKFYFCQYMQQFSVLKYEDIPLLKMMSKRQKYIILNNVFCKENTFIFLLWTESLILYGLYSFKRVLSIFVNDIKRKV